MAFTRNLVWFVFCSEIFPISEKEIKQLQIGQNIFEMFKETKKKYKYLINAVQKLGFVFKNMVLCSKTWFCVQLLKEPPGCFKLLFSAQVVLAA